MAHILEVIGYFALGGSVGALVTALLIAAGQADDGGEE